MPVVDRDHVLAHRIAGLIANGKSQFIYVNKVGAHFPVADKFPDSAALYRPLPQRGKTAAITWLNPMRDAHKGTPEEWRLYRNAYRNAVAWNVGGFFDTLLPQVDLAKTVIIYTSDHGQDLHERGNPGKGTHCTSDPLQEEGAVPLVAIDSRAAPRLDWQAHFAANRNAMSHYRIFPTLLELMGYVPKDISETYGPSLISPAKDPLTFNANYFAALGIGPKWRRVDRKTLAVPPAADYQPALTGK